MPLKTYKRTMPAECTAIHHAVRTNLRHLMNEHQVDGKRKKGIGIIKTAQLAGVGVGSIQSILGDPNHSPSLRVLNKLAQGFGVPVTRLLQAQEA